MKFSTLLPKNKQEANRQGTNISHLQGKKKNKHYRCREDAKVWEEAVSRAAMGTLCCRAGGRERSYRCWCRAVAVLVPRAPQTGAAMCAPKLNLGAPGAVISCFSVQLHKLKHSLGTKGSSCRSRPFYSCGCRRKSSTGLLCSLIIKHVKR